jgi:hypothetical protein
MMEKIDGLTEIIEPSASGKTVYRARVRDNQIAVGTGWTFPEAARDLAAGLRKQAEWIEAWMDKRDQDGST